MYRMRTLLMFLRVVRIRDTVPVRVHNAGAEENYHRISIKRLVNYHRRVWKNDYSRIISILYSLRIRQSFRKSLKV